MAHHSETDPLVFDRVSKSFRSREGEVVPAVEDVTFSVPRGSIVCVVGPTGCGKSTLLRLAAGLEEPEAGHVDAPSGRKGEGQIGYLTQRHTLLPWLTAADNVKLPLRIRGEAEDVVEERSRDALELLGLAAFAGLYPYELSGGMQQRAALGRLLTADASCWLLDEPFASLDERTRHRLQDLVVELNGSRGGTILFVTHSIDEAVYIADEVHVLSAGPGRIIESLDLGEPRPRNRMSDASVGRLECIRKKLEEAIA